MDETYERTLLHQLQAIHAVQTRFLMPRLDGYATARKLRSDGFDKPIVAATACAMNGDREKSIAAGCDAFLSKPIRRSKLLAVLRELISAARGATA